MRNVASIGLEEALVIQNKILEIAVADGDKPVAIAVVGADAQLITFVAMNEVVPLSITIAQNKAYTAAMGRKSTKYQAEKPAGFDGRNVGDERFTAFAGGVALVDSAGHVVGAVGVSGRKAQNERQHAPWQDHELASIGGAWSGYVDLDEVHREAVLAYHLGI